MTQITITCGIVMLLTPSHACSPERSLRPSHAIRGADLQPLKSTTCGAGLRQKFMRLLIRDGVMR